MKKILGKLFYFILLAGSIAYAGVEVSLDAPAAYRGDSVKYTIIVEGRDVEFPDISSIGSYPVVGTSSSQSMHIMNGVASHTISKTYRFRPDKSLIIPSYRVKVDGDEFKTEELKLEVLKPTAATNGSAYVLQMELDKNESYAGEAIGLNILFKQRIDAHADKIQLGEPKLEDFWVKKVDDVEKYNEGKYIVQKIRYKIFPQKAGKYTIPAIEALVGKRSRKQRGSSFFDDPFFDSFTQRLNWKKIYSNDLNIKVNALPNGLELYGNYTIEAKVDKRSIYANKPVNLTINIRGDGNIDDIKKFEPSIDNVIVYADEPKISTQLVNNVYGGEFSQKIALIADSNFTVPALSLEYFDKVSKSVKTISTQSIEIEVKGGISKGASHASGIEVSPKQLTSDTPSLKVESSTEVLAEKNEDYIKYLFFLFGFILGLVTMYGINHLKNRVRSEEKDIVKAIRKAKTDKELFALLLPYSNEHTVVGDALNKLEDNIYRNGKNKIDREDLMEVFE